MRLFNRLEDMTPEEIQANAEAKAWVLGLFSRSHAGWPPEGRLSHEVQVQTWGNLLAIVATAILFLTGLIGRDLYLVGIIGALVFGAVLAVLAVYGLYRDIHHAVND